MIKLNEQETWEMWKKDDKMRKFAKDLLRSIIDEDYDAVVDAWKLLYKNYNKHIVDADYKNFITAYKKKNWKGMRKVVYDMFPALESKNENFGFNEQETWEVWKKDDKIRKFAKDLLRGILDQDYDAVMDAWKAFYKNYNKNIVDTDHKNFTTAYKKKDWKGMKKTVYDMFPDLENQKENVDLINDTMDILFEVKDLLADSEAERKKVVSSAKKSKPKTEQPKIDTKLNPYAKKNRK